jgi:hypothetical protein
MFVPQGTLSDQRQVTIFDPIHDSVRAALEQRLEEYSTQSCLSVFAGTWNLNGRVGERPISWQTSELTQNASLHLPSH